MQDITTSINYDSNYSDHEDQIWTEMVASHRCTRNKEKPGNIPGGARTLFAEAMGFESEAGST